MGFNVGIVGLPNVGKSTLFNALTRAAVESANYPFTTIEPNVGVVPVPDERLTKIAKIGRSQSIVPTTVRFVDIAGLVAGASKGEGLGNQFLANIRETQAIAHVVRCFENDDVIHVAGKVDPIADVQVINTELALADLESVEKALGKVAKEVKKGDKEALQLQSLLEKARSHLDGGNPLRSLMLDEKTLTSLFPYQFLTLKPTLYIANVDESSLLRGNEHLRRLESLASEEKSQVVTICSKLEAEIVELSEEEQKEFLESLSLTEPGLNRVIRAGYSLLGLLTFFTVGPKEARAWTCEQNATAPEAAGVIHTDFEKGFIRAEVIGYEDYIQCQGEQGAKEAGKWRLEGKEYRVKDGDIMLFRFNV